MFNRDNLKPCPHPGCRADRPAIRITRLAAWIWCEGCGLRGPKTESYNASCIAWNTIPRLEDLTIPAARPPWLILRELANDLMESRRYVRHPHAVTEEFLEDELERLEDCPLGELAKWTASGIRRALRFVRVEPAWLESALYAAAAELREYASQLEPKKDPA